jgi:hypothetical protein
MDCQYICGIKAKSRSAPLHIFHKILKINIMNKPIHRSSICFPAIIALSLLSGVAVAQSADQSFKTIPQQIKQNAETKAVVKSNTVANNATNKLDSASNKAFKGMTGLFKKKKPAKGDSTVVHPVDSTVVPSKSSSRAGGKFAPIAAAYAMRRRTC